MTFVMTEFQVLFRVFSGAAPMKSSAGVRLLPMLTFQTLVPVTGASVVAEAGVEAAVSLWASDLSRAFTV